MGCDIRAIFQTKNEFGYWHDVPSEWDQGRDYRLFCWLADVRRHDGFPAEICQPRGFPDDFQHDGDIHHINEVDLYPRRFCRDEIRAELDKTGKIDVWMGEHSHSWLLGSEMVHHARMHGLADQFRVFIDEINRLMDIHGEIRMVFGFDS